MSDAELARNMLTAIITVFFTGVILTIITDKWICVKDWCYTNWKYLHLQEDKRKLSKFTKFIMKILYRIGK